MRQHRLFDLGAVELDEDVVAVIKYMARSRAMLNEADFTTIVMEIGIEAGYLMYHQYNSSRDPRGFPDIVAVHPTRGDLFFAELKTERGQLTPAQVQWRGGMTAAGVPYYVWRPTDLPAIRLRFGPKPEVVTPAV